MFLDGDLYFISSLMVGFFYLKYTKKMWSPPKAYYSQFLFILILSFFPHKDLESFFDNFYFVLSIGIFFVNRRVSFMIVFKNCIYNLDLMFSSGLFILKPQMMRFLVLQAIHSIVDSFSCLYVQKWEVLVGIF